MRSGILLLIAFITFYHSYSQNARSLKSMKEEADRFYEDEQYHLAIQYYRELADRNAADADVCYRLADCYTKTFNYPEAEAYYLKVYFLAPQQFPLSLYYYALMLKYNANFDESILYFNDFISRHQSSRELKEIVEQAIIDRAGCETAKEELQAPGASDTKFIPLNINTTFNDFASAVRDSLSIVITSGRITSNRQVSAKPSRTIFILKSKDPYGSTRPNNISPLPTLPLMMAVVVLTGKGTSTIFRCAGEMDRSAGFLSPLSGIAYGTNR